jgi:hypothetical protein
MSNVIEGNFGPKKTMRMKAAGYKRNFKETESLGYEEKFSDLFDICEQAESGGYEAIAVAYPEVLGDTEEELIRNMSIIAEAGLVLIVTQKSPRIVEAANVP